MTQTAELIKQLRQGSLSNDDYRWEAAARIEQLEAALRSIDEQFAEAAQDDCENGVRWLNERAAEKYLYEYPHTSAAISFAHKVSRAVLDYREMDVQSIGHEGGSCPRERT